MLILSCLTLLDMQGILESDLSVNLCPIILRHSILHGLEVEKIERIGESVQKLFDAFRIDVLTTSLRCLYLHLLFIVQLHRGQIVEKDLPIMIIVKCFLERHAIEVEDGRFVLWNAVLTFAKVEEGTFVRLRTMFGQVEFWFGLIIDDLQSQFN